MAIGEGDSSGEPRYHSYRVRRLDDHWFLRGRIILTDDIDGLGALLPLSHGDGVLPHAAITNVDWSRAARVPGFVAALSSRDLTERFSSFLSSAIGRRASAATLSLPVDRLRCVGEGVVAVLATSRSAVGIAATEVLVEYREHPGVIEPEAALSPGAPRLHSGWPDDEAFRWNLTFGDVDAAFRSADAILELQLVNQRLYAAFMEPRAAPTVDSAHRQLTMWASTQTPRALPAGIAAHSILLSIRSAW